MQKIVIADDSPDLLEVLSLLLTMQGYLTAIALTGGELLTHLETNTPDCILLDVMFGGLDGRELCLQIKTSTPTVKIVLLSANPELLQEFKDCGADAIIEKPFDIHFVVQQIKNLL